MADSRSLPLPQLDQQRLLAVRLRIRGLTLREIAEQTGLSTPTIIAAHKAYLAAGWDAVPVRRRGRQAGDGRALTPEQEQEMFGLLMAGPPDQLGLPFLLWELEALQALAAGRFGLVLPDRTAGHYLERWALSAPRPVQRVAAAGPAVQRWHALNYPGIVKRCRREGAAMHWVDEGSIAFPDARRRSGLIRAVTNRGKVRWMAYEGALRAPHLIEFFDRLVRASGCKIVVMLEGMLWQRAATFGAWLQQRPHQIHVYHLPPANGMAFDASVLASELRPPSGQLLRPHARAAQAEAAADPMAAMLKHLLADTGKSSARYAKKTLRREEKGMTLSHLQRLEAESIHAMREVVAEADNPVMLYSVGKDSAVMLHLAMKAFYPAKPPFRLLHIDTTWKFREMYTFRDQMVDKLGLDLLVHVNPDGLKQGINPFVHGSGIHTDIMKTQALKQAIETHGFDVALGGARRDEEKSRAKERIFSFRSEQHRWDPKTQRPELWHLYNARKHKGETVRVFPLSNWTELDIWQYIHLENIPIVPLYFARPRPVVERNGSLIMVDDERLPLNPGEVPMIRNVRFRTLGCYPLTGAVESTADTLPAIIHEMLLTTTSERQGRVIDHDSVASMEKKKQEGYF